MMAVNLGTGTPKDAVELLEYCNGDMHTYWADKRRENGREAPYNVKLWCLGNEMDGPWQICSKTATEYGRIACETAKLMKMFDPTIEAVACGSSYRTMPTFGTWEEEVLRQSYPYVDYLSLHQYYTNHEGDVMNFLARSEEMGEFIQEVAAICEKIRLEVGSDKHIGLSFDEWNVWYHYAKNGRVPEKWTVARPIEEENYDFADALLVGSMLNTLLNHADVVKVACLAQLVNALAPIMTEPGGRAWAQTTYWPFLYGSQFGRGTALQQEVDAARNFFSFEVISNDLLCIRRRWRTETDLSVKTPGAPQRIRQLPNVICGRDYKYGIILDRVDPCLHGDILRCITARAILVGKLVHIIQKNNGRRFSRRFDKGLRNAVDKGIATLVAAYRDGV